jgi:trigger factor
VDSNSDWVIKATTCEIPEVILGDYKKKVAGELRSLKLTVNDKDTKTTKPSDDQVITALLKSVDVVVPQILIEEEVNGRLSQLLARIEKLGLTLEGYLASIKEDSNTLRDKYTQQAKEAIILEVALNKISEEEKIVVTDKEVDQFIVSTGSDPSKVQKEQKDTLIRVIQRRKALEILANLQ